MEVWEIDILKVIKERRSIHTFKEELVNEAILKEIFTYGSYAPSHYMKESWNVKIYEGNGKNVFVDSIMKSYQRVGMIKDNNDPKTLKMIKSMKSFLLAIPHHALIYFEREEEQLRYEEEYSSVAAFIQNAQLAAWEYGVGMLWTITPYMHDPYFAEEIGLDSERFKIAAVMQIGYPDRVPRDKGRKPIEEKLEFIRE
ncbi:nitroreductase family protein [Virgibacillus oceani]